MGLPGSIAPGIQHSIKNFFIGDLNNPHLSSLTESEA